MTLLQFSNQFPQSFYKVSVLFMLNCNPNFYLHRLLKVIQGIEKNHSRNTYQNIVIAYNTFLIGFLMVLIRIL